MNPSKINQQGATLIESLVSLIVLAVAVLGMLGVQIRTLIETNISANRSQAIILVEDLSERIKSNPRRYESLGLYADKEITTASISPANCGLTACNPEQLAQYDIAQWSNSVVNNLPSGKARTFRSENDSRQLGVLIGWVSKEKTGDTDYTEKFTFESKVLKDGVSCWSNYICHLVYIQP